MRILHATITMDPSWGGPPRVAARLSAAQAALGHEVTILSYGSAQTASAVREMTAGIPGMERVSLDYLAPGTMAEKVLARRGRGRVAELLAGRPAPDVVHLHGVWEPFLKAVADAARARRIPYFLQPNGMLDEWCMRQRRLKKRLALTLGYRRMLDRAAGILCGNAGEQVGIRRLGLTSPVITVPLNAVFPEETLSLPAPGRFKRRVPALGGAPFLIFLGRLHVKKGLDHLADAFALFTRNDALHHLVVVGHDEGALGDFHRRIALAGIEARVHLVGPLHGLAMWEALADATAFTLPSRHEGFSIAITEALACGLPVIISRECNFPEVAQSGAGVVVDLDARALAGAFQRVLADESSRRRMAEAAKNLVLSRYDCRRMAEEVVHAYRHHGG